MDTIPKALMHFLVNRTKDAIQNELVQALYKEERFGELLAVCSHNFCCNFPRSRPW